MDDEAVQRKIEAINALFQNADIQQRLAADCELAWRTIESAAFDLLIQKGWEIAANYLKLELSRQLPELCRWIGSHYVRKAWNRFKRRKPKDGSNERMVYRLGTLLDDLEGIVKGELEALWRGHWKNHCLLPPEHVVADNSLDFELDAELRQINAERRQRNRIHLRKCIRRLPSPYRETVKLEIDFPYATKAEIAQRAGVVRQTYWERRCKAHDLLRECLGSLV